jgi:hypothetical protein
MAEESTWKALRTMKCPKCHSGNMFSSSNTYNLRKIHEMPEHCQECGQSFNPEPGFYTGAMYVNYGLTVVLSAITYLVLEIMLNVSALVCLDIQE